MLPQRLADAFLPDHLAGRPLAEVPDRDLADLEGFLRDWQVCPTGTAGYGKAEVTLGGVATSELSQRTMQSNTVPGLFVIGEAVDVTGWLGGFNFQWAWSSGVAAGEAV
jgi:predicted flavoprotein YhiN